MMEQLKQHKILIVVMTISLLFTILSMALSLLFLKNARVSRKPVIPPAVVTPSQTEVNTIQIPFSNNNSLTPIPTNELNTSNSLTIKDFLKSASKNDNGDYIIATVPNNYTITYTPDTHKFLITINGTPFTQIQTIAEKALLTQLGITPQQACKITIAITTPATVNPEYAAFEYAPSFCFTPKQNQDFQTAVYLTNHLPSSDNYTVSADYIADPYYHYQFTVVLSSGIDKQEAQKEFTDWMHSINLSDSQIQSLDIVYQGQLQYEAPPANSAPTNASY